MANEKRLATCPTCGRDIEIRGTTFAHQTIANHMKREHK